MNSNLCQTIVSDSNFTTQLISHLIHPDSKRTQRFAKKISKPFVREFWKDFYHKNQQDFIQELKEKFDHDTKKKNKEHVASHLLELGKRIAEVTHELGAPIGIIYNLSTLILNGMKQKDKAYSDVQLIQAQSRRTQILLHQLRLKPNTPYAKKEMIRIQRALENTLEDLNMLFELKNVHLTYDIKSSLPEIQGSLIDFESIFFNLITNALQAMPHGGTLNLKIEKILKAHKDYICVVISDTGAGIKKENLNKIFEPFFSEKKGGIGLGLPLVKKVIESYSGHIIVKSQFGKGTQINVYIPIRVSFRKG